MTRARRSSFPGTHPAVALGWLLCIASAASAATRIEAIHKHEVIVAAIRTAGTPAAAYWKDFADRYERTGAGSVVFADPRAGQGQPGGVAEALRDGTINLTVMPDSLVSELVPEFSILRLPGLVSSDLQVENSFRKCIQPILAPQFAAAGLVMLGPMRSGWLVVYGVGAVATPADLAGRPFRKGLSPVTNGYLAALGARLVPVPYPEIATWLAVTPDGLGDFSLVELTSMARSKPPIRVLTLTRHGFFLGAVVADKDWHDGLGQRDRRALVDALPDQKQWAEDVAAYEQEYLAEARASGVTVTDIAPTDQGKWAQTAAAYRESFLRGNGPRWHQLHDCIEGLPST